MNPSACFGETLQATAGRHVTAAHGGYAELFALASSPGSGVT